MGSSSKKRQTMAKFTRERAVKEKRARKQEKREERRQAALGTAGEGLSTEDVEASANGDAPEPADPGDA